MIRGSFASDNYASAMPEVLEAISSANRGHAPAYGMDEWTVQMQQRFADAFGPEALAFAVFNGTGANVVALRSVTRPYDAVICAATSHMHVDECGAPERVGGFKLLAVDTPDGKLTPELVAPRLVRFGDEHAAQPRVISITQSTELGTVYTPDEIRALADLAHSHEMLLHVDGARIANAAVSLGLPLAAITTDVGVDLLSFGATKNGAVGAEAVVLLHADIGDGIRFMRKQSMQLASKMRFVSAQLEVLLRDELWRKPAAEANHMAKRLERAMSDIDGVRITQRVQANAVFAILPPAATAQLQQEWLFYIWDESTGEVRWMCSWDTRAEDVDAFADAVRAAVGATVASSG